MFVLNPYEYFSYAARNNLKVLTEGQLNIVGFRNSKGRVNYFDDILALYYLDYGVWRLRYWPITTSPGVHWLTNLMNPKGAAIVVPGFYEDVYEIGEFKGYKALRQVGNLKVYRDYNKDEHIDKNSATIEEGLFGIHIHRAGVLSRLVGNWSAGCQVFQKKFDFEYFIAECEAKVSAHGKFNYTLIEL